MEMFIKESFLMIWLMAKESIIILMGLVILVFGLRINNRELVRKSIIIILDI
jgi:hypothetical protein